MSAKDDICPAITIVIYYGERPWTAPLSIREAVTGPDWLKENVSDWPMILVEASKGKYTFKNEANKNLFSMLAVFGRHASRKAAMDEIVKIATALGPNNDAAEAMEAIIGSELIPKSERGKGVHQFVIEYGKGSPHRHGESGDQIAALVMEVRNIAADAAQNPIRNSGRKTSAADQLSGKARIQKRASQLLCGCPL